MARMSEGQFLMLRLTYKLISIYCSDIPNVHETDDTSQPLLLIDTAGCDLYELDLPEEISKGNEGIPFLKIRQLFLFGFF